ncbi:MAG: hypothetical protein B6D39_10740 [Anaerolineae bacterium UTCFX2]|jgi:pimeloyl-ACP methyl ester carboxylesterase|nr:alpha/beta hydrolase [Anaerolineae bacterium]MCZ7553987.1 alpha/beta hydrolase [Anaerolineales bacterium]OQY88754.1 MAG: hypothetical protein B6D39_10740 [Anaerolineae bacterium UTCFX2]
MKPNFPYEDFGGTGPLLHFTHANGYPPKAYQRLLSGLSEHYHVLAMHMRPLWLDSSPEDLHDWRVLAQDLDDFLTQHGSTQWIGIGHSVGANATLRLALSQPERFSALVLLDPVIFPPYMTYLWEVVYRLGLAYRLHPLVRSALKRRNRFTSRAEMYENYRSKPVFSRISDEDLQYYVEALACPDIDGSVTLCYPSRWEARIYVTGIRADLEIWQRLPELVPPALVIRGGLSDTFLPVTAKMLAKKQPKISILSFSDATHLVPLEKPLEVTRSILDFLGIQENRKIQPHSQPDGV